MRKLIVIAIFLAGFSTMSLAQDNMYDDTTVTETIVEAVEEDTYEENIYEVTDTSLIPRYINISEDSIRNWRQKKEFRYMNNLDSLLKASQQVPPPVTRVPRTGSFMNRLLNGSFIKGMLWILAVIFVAAIVYHLLKSNGLFMRKTASKVSSAPDEEDVLSLQHNFDELVEQACRQGDYRIAVRYLFLRTLQQLRDKEHISYEPDKTNSRYVYELPVNWRNDFSRLIFQYEYVWYGYFDISKEQYENMQKGFASFFQKV